MDGQDRKAIGSSISERLLRRTRSRDRLGVGEALLARFGVDGDLGGLLDGPVDGQADGDFVFLSIRPYLARMQRLAQARRRRELRLSRFLDRAQGHLRTQSWRRWPGVVATPSAGPFAAASRVLGGSDFKLPPPPVAAPAAVEAEPAAAPAARRRERGSTARTSDSPWLVTPWTGARVASASADALSRRVEDAASVLGRSARGRRLQQELIELIELPAEERAVRIRRVLRQASASVRTIVEEIEAAVPEARPRPAALARQRMGDGVDQPRRGLRPVLADTPAMRSVQPAAAAPDAPPASPRPVAAAASRSASRAGAWLSTSPVRKAAATAARQALSASPVARARATAAPIRARDAQAAAPARARTPAAPRRRTSASPPRGGTPRSPRAGPDEGPGAPGDDDQLARPAPPLADRGLGSAPDPSSSLRPGAAGPALRGAWRAADADDLALDEPAAPSAAAHGATARAYARLDLAAVPDADVPEPALQRVLAAMDAPRRWSGSAVVRAPSGQLVPARTLAAPAATTQDDVIDAGAPAAAAPRPRSAPTPARRATYVDAQPSTARVAVRTSPALHAADRVDVTRRPGSLLDRAVRSPVSVWTLPGSTAPSRGGRAMGMPARDTVLLRGELGGGDLGGAAPRGGDLAPRAGRSADARLGAAGGRQLRDGGLRDGDLRAGELRAGDLRDGGPLDGGLRDGPVPVRLVAEAARRGALVPGGESGASRRPLALSRDGSGAFVALREAAGEPLAASAAPALPGRAQARAPLAGAARRSGVDGPDSPATWAAARLDAPDAPARRSSLVPPVVTALSPAPLAAPATAAEQAAPAASRRTAWASGSAPATGRMATRETVAAAQRADRLPLVGRAARLAATPAATTVPTSGGAPAADGRVVAVVRTRHRPSPLAYARKFGLTSPSQVVIEVVDAAPGAPPRTPDAGAPRGAAAADARRPTRRDPTDELGRLLAQLDLPARPAALERLDQRALATAAWVLDAQGAEPPQAAGRGAAAASTTWRWVADGVVLASARAAAGDSATAPDAPAAGAPRRAAGGPGGAPASMWAGARVAGGPTSRRGPAARAARAARGSFDLAGTYRAPLAAERRATPGRAPLELGPSASPLRGGVAPSLPDASPAGPAGPGFHPGLPGVAPALVAGASTPGRAPARPRPDLALTLGAVEVGVDDPRLPTWARRSSGEPLIHREDRFIEALARATAPEDVVRVIYERAERGGLTAATGLPAPVIQVIEQIRTVAEAVSVDTDTTLRAGPGSDREVARRARGDAAPSRPTARVARGFSSLRGGGTAASRDGIGTDKLSKLSKRLHDLILLAERQKDAARQEVRMAEDSAAARAEGQASPSAAEGGNDKKIDIEALGREVLEVVSMELEMRKQRTQEGSDEYGWW